MSEPFIGEIRMFGFNWAPHNWAICNGALLPITTNAALYSLLQTQFGGNGTSTFGIPDFRGRMPMHHGQDNTGIYDQGQFGGQETVTLTTANLPPHTHEMNAVSTPATVIPLRNPVVLAQSEEPSYIDSGTLVTMNPGTCGTSGGGQSHPNIQPSQCVGFCIALQGLYPQRN